MGRGHSRETYRNIRDVLVDWVQKNTAKLQEDVLNEVAETFCYRVKRRIRSASYQMAPDSRPAIENIANSVFFKKARKNGKTAHVDVDKKNYEEFLFLEFGTGLKGKENPHPDASAVGWKYATGKDNYFRAYKRPNYGKLLGWSFELTDKSRKLVTKDDITMKSMYSKYKYETKQGEVTKYYKRGTRSRRNWVHTSGIKPVRAFYNTKREFKRFLGYYSETKGNVFNLIKKLRKMRNEKVEVTNG